jgi:hypothetical protein
MRAVYRIIHYSPYPSLSARLPIGALVRSGDGVRLARARMGPDPEAFGSKEAWTAVKLTLEAFSEVADLRLPAIAGPQVSLGREVTIPNDVVDPVRWVEEQVLSHHWPAGGSVTKTTAVTMWVKELGALRATMFPTGSAGDVLDSSWQISPSSLPRWVTKTVGVVERSRNTASRSFPVLSSEWKGAFASKVDFAQPYRSEGESPNPNLDVAALEKDGT